MTVLSILPNQLEENVLRPICDKIICYLESIMQGARDTIDAVVLAGGVCSSEYLVELIVNACKKTSTKLIFPCEEGGLQSVCFDIVKGAILKSIDKVEVFEPAIAVVLDDEKYSKEESEPKVHVFIGICLRSIDKRSWPRYCT